MMCDALECWRAHQGLEHDPSWRLSNVTGSFSHMLCKSCKRAMAMAHARR